MSGPPIFVITGQLAAGKSTLARALVERFPRGVHVDVDGMREMVVSGHASPLAWTEETTRQFRLAVAASVRVAAIYYEAGYAVAIEGAFDAQLAQEALADLGLWDAATPVELYPPLEVALQRNRSRTNKGFETSILDETIRRLDAELGARPPPDGWVRIDNGGETVAQTVDRILAAASG